MPLILLLNGCIGIQTYTSPEHQKYRPDDLQIPKQPLAVRVEADFYRNGVTAPAITPILQKSVEQALQRTKVAVAHDKADHTLKVSANNIADIGQAIGKGFKTGLTLGASGSAVQDGYEFGCSYIDKQKVLFTENYPHAVISTIGNANPPAGLVSQGNNLNLTFSTVVFDIVVNCLGDIQKKGYLNGQTNM